MSVHSARPDSRAARLHALRTAEEALAQATLELAAARQVSIYNAGVVLKLTEELACVRAELIELRPLAALADRNAQRAQILEAEIALMQDTKKEGGAAGDELKAVDDDSPFLNGKL